MLDDLYDVLGSLEACSYVRQHASGQILFMDAAQAEEEDALRMLLNELLARSLEQGHTYALCRCTESQTALQSALSVSASMLTTEACITGNDQSTEA